MKNTYFSHHAIFSSLVFLSRVAFVLLIDFKVIYLISNPDLGFIDPG